MYIKWSLYDSVGDPIVGVPPYPTVKIRRTSDGYLFDFNDNTFNTNPVQLTSNLSIVEVSLLQGRFGITIDTSDIIQWTDGEYEIFLEYAGTPKQHLEYSNFVRNGIVVDPLPISYIGQPDDNDPQNSLFGALARGRNQLETFQRLSNTTVSAYGIDGSQLEPLTITTKSLITVGKLFAVRLGNSAFDADIWDHFGGDVIYSYNDISGLWEKSPTFTALIDDSRYKLYFEYQSDFDNNEVNIVINDSVIGQGRIIKCNLQKTVGYQNNGFIGVDKELVYGAEYSQENDTSRVYNRLTRLSEQVLLDKLRAGDNGDIFTSTGDVTIDLYLIDEDRSLNVDSKEEIVRLIYPNGFGGIPSIETIILNAENSYTATATSGFDFIKISNYTTGVVLTTSRNGEVLETYNLLENSGRYLGLKGTLLDWMQNGLSVSKLETNSGGIDPEVEQKIIDLHDSEFGRWVIDTTSNTLTKYKVNGEVLKVYDLTEVVPKTYGVRTPQV